MSPPEDDAPTGDGEARAIDLGQFSVYLKTRIAGAPAGIVTPVPASPPPVPTTQNNSPPADAKP